MKVKMTKNEFYVKAIHHQLFSLNNYTELVDRIAEILDLEFEKEMPPEPVDSIVVDSENTMFRRDGGRWHAPGWAIAWTWEQLWESGVTGIYDKRAEL